MLPINDLFLKILLSLKKILILCFKKCSYETYIYGFSGGSNEA